MIGPNEIMIIGAIIVLLFGASKLPELAHSVGKSMGEFKKAQKEAEKELSEFERSLEAAPKETKKSKVVKMAEELGIATKGKTEDELLDEIQKTLNKRESVKT
ncbi:MAG: twin-arginine translocase TatA/TatE family subunit [Methanosarcinales archaeon]|nr:MAG: twin-arginine translocase TatA/TatE family subunit [Methanosarcinales archaeon]